MIDGREVDGGMEGGKPRTGTINDTFCCVQKMDSDKKSVTTSKAATIIACEIATERLITDAIRLYL